MLAKQNLSLDIFITNVHTLTMEKLQYRNQNMYFDILANDYQHPS
jgi:hypothetical protein